VKVLVIDDEGMIRTLAEKILVRAGHDVFLADSGQQGLDLFREYSEKIDLLIIDMTMDGMSGEDTLRACRVIQPCIAAVFSSGQNLQESDIPADLAINTSFLQKPYRASQLVDMVEQAVAAAVPVE